VVALDEETYRTPPFQGTPAITWTREIGQVLTAVIAGGAKVVGFDIVFPTSIEQSEIPIGNETLGAKVRGFDRDFLSVLAREARAGKVVLGQIQHGDYPILPTPAQRIAVGQKRNIRSLNVYTDPDDVVRRIPLTVMTDGSAVPSMAVELAARALGNAPELAADGTMTLSGYAIPASVPNTLTLNFDGGADDIPTFSFADLRVCMDKDSTNFFRHYFDGKVVLFGTRLDVEDRNITSKRFATGPEGVNGPRCLPQLPAASTRFARDSIAGVYIIATAANNLINRDALSELGRLSRGLISIALAGLVAATAMTLPLWFAAPAYLAVTAMWTAGATVALVHAVSLPLFEPLLAGLIALAATIGFRFVIADKDRWFLRKSFAFYLAPAIIEEMIALNKLPALGGETRNVTVFFSDITAFSSISENLTPTHLVALMNQYFSTMTDIIQDHGGFVDKYIGDAIVAVFGAPFDDKDHATSAVRAALRCCERLSELNHALPTLRGRTLEHRIGLHSGGVLVGNIGSPKRFNYTVMGDAVNLASRLQGANKFFGTSIIASENTFYRARSVCAWRELDVVRVQGRAEPVKVYEPLARRGEETSIWIAAYADGLARWRAQDFGGCIECLMPIADADPPSAMLLGRAKRLTIEPPSAEWDGVTVLDGK
jgi:adenylate cyclase